MNLIYAITDATLFIKYSSSSKVSVKVNDVIISSKKIEYQKFVYQKFKNLPYGPVTITVNKKDTVVHLSSYITAFDLDQMENFTFNFGQQFKILYVNNNKFGPSRQMQHGSVIYNKFMPPIFFKGQPEIFFLPIEPDFAPIFTISAKQSFTHSNLGGKSNQDFQYENFHYQLMDWNESIDLKSFSTHEIKSLDIPRPLTMGHRGCGSNSFQRFNSHFNTSHFYENTIESFNEAYKRVDAVELDVILTNDLIPVVNHNFWVQNGTKKIAINSITAEQFKNIPMQNNQNRIKQQKQNQRATLTEVLNQTDEKLMINIEIKYVTGTTKYVVDEYFSRSQVIKAVLNCIKKSKQHKIMFSTFDPVTAVMLKYIQNKYPVMFLNNGDGVFAEADDVDLHQDICLYLEKGVNFSSKFGLQGIITSVTLLLEIQQHVGDILDLGLEIFTWGSIPSDHRNIVKQLNMGVNCIIYDLVTLIEPK
ncbi:Glycerophosphoryl_diester phosphodiesterase family protein [Hexamita inflata]|uniref:Glycerophosphoryl diester phosphodiesterase family protein n=1 Tax=Hexamita inflata TaxID=28002 RepID=A0AA86QX19_9EUKA|nr:Glycerophosphoryl diester phosphodiesterase family protein [Hexamita inflata]